jgi:outer membrane protein TolC
MNKIFIIVLILITFNTLLAKDEESIKFTLKDCIDMAMDNNPSIIRARQDIKVAESLKTQALATYLPNLKYTGIYQKSNQGNGTIVSGIYFPAVPIDDYSGTVSVSQTVFDTFKGFFQYKQYKAQIEQYEYALKESATNVALTVAQDYFNAARAKDILKFRENTLENSLKYLDRANENFKVGLSPKSDVFTAEVNVTQAKVDLLSAQNDIKNKMVQLKIDTGLSVDRDISISGETYELKYRQEMNEALSTAMEQRPEMKKYNAQIEYQNKVIDGAKLQRLPNVTVGVSYNYATDSYLSPDRYYSVYGQVNFPIFDGFSTKSQVESAEATKTQYISDKLKQERTIISDVTTAYYDMETNSAKLELNRLQVKQANLNLEIAEGKYTSGVGSFQDILNRQDDYSKAIINLINVTYDYQISLAKFKKATGEELP